MFWFMNNLINPLLLAILGSRFHKALSGSLAGLRVYGAKSGRAYTLITNYLRVGNTVYIVPAMPQKKTWWRNLRKPAPVQVLLDGSWQPATAHALQAPADAAELVSALDSLKTAGAKPIGAPLPGEPIADGMVLVLAELAG